MSNGMMNTPWVVDGQATECRCPVCGEWVPLRRSQTGKPHSFCPSCGLQLFFRQEPCIRALEADIRSERGEFARAAKE